MMQNVAVSLGGIVFVLAGFYRMYTGYTEWAEGGRIAERETTPIRDLESGAVEVKGTAHLVEDGTTRQSPFSETDAVATHIKVQEWRTGSEEESNWKTIFEEETAEPVLVDDGTGEVLVELPADGGLNLESTETKVESHEEPPDAIRRYVEMQPDLDVPKRRSVGALSIGEPRRYVEGVLEPSEEVYVLGNARESNAGWGERDFVIDEQTADGDFVLSNKSEETLAAEGKQGGFVFLVFGGLLTVLGLGALVYGWLVI
ncbi:GIDE domain-containing protein [Halorubrum sp. AD140]|uniref:GIDE domain-containing protein n=1 Tax=Halorubrum sp. AD140 TaxID=3050073 RepID=UPI002ACCB879|nr:GIDE domain-containing protein [Halorubrum sp. AD140]MDZ5811647.1 GIDE domain-containing protein [Halorubrum sp. AD140]